MPAYQLTYKNSSGNMETHTFHSHDSLAREVVFYLRAGCDTLRIEPVKIEPLAPDAVTAKPTAPAARLAEAVGR